jgi:hypothetical protein
MEECACAGEVSSAMEAWIGKGYFRDYGFGMHPRKEWEEVYP